MYGCEPDIPGHMHEVRKDCFEEPSWEKLIYLMGKSMERHEDNHVKIKKHLDEMDKEIVSTIEGREFKALTNLHFG